MPSLSEWIQWMSDNPFMVWSTAAISGLVSAMVGMVLVAKLIQFWWRFSRHQYPRRAAFPVQQTTKEGNTCQIRQSLQEPAGYSLSIVVPAYREEGRLPGMLKSTLTYLRHRQKRDPGFTYEVIVVDDGSPDGTAQVVLNSMQKGETNLKLIRFPENQGKGAAVCEGMLAALGERILFADADGSTRINDLERLEVALSKASGLACGSRNTQGSSGKVKVQRSWLRSLLMHAFHRFIGLVGVHGINDTQCGFKMLTRQCARDCLPQMHLDGWIFDCELILMARWLGYAVAEVPVNWEERSGSKLNVAIDSIRMALDLVFMRLAYGLGLWRIPPPKKAK